MGCAGGRGVLNANEKAITSGEDLLNWNKVDVVKAMKSLDHYTHGPLISTQQFKVAAGEIGLLLTDAEEIDSKPFKFYKSIQ
jgi:hypothetical protein